MALADRYLFILCRTGALDALSGQYKLLRRRLAMLTLADLSFFCLCRARAAQMPRDSMSCCTARLRRPLQTCWRACGGSIPTMCASAGRAWPT